MLPIILFAGIPAFVASGIVLGIINFLFNATIVANAKKKAMRDLGGDFVTQAAIEKRFEENSPVLYTISLYSSAAVIVGALICAALFVFVTFF